MKKAFRVLKPALMKSALNVSRTLETLICHKKIKDTDIGIVVSRFMGFVDYFMARSYRNHAVFFFCFYLGFIQINLFF